MPWTYSEEVVRVTYHLRNPRNYSPSARQLNEWDEDLVAKYESRLDASLQAAGIAVTTENRSLIVQLATMSNGRSSQIQLNNACKYFKNVWP
ncbi:MAG: hypothetical protein RL685_1940 [Pseudomonadota bacterium]